MRIRRSRLTADYVQIPNGTVRDSRLSYMARGILCELLSRPDGWEATADDLWRQTTTARGSKGEGRRVFRAAFAELKELGYLVAERAPLHSGRHGTVLTLNDIPTSTDVPRAGTSVPPAQTCITAGRTDVPHAGTSENSTDVPHAGTSDSPAKTDNVAGRTDVPLTDVPHAGTSKEEDGEKKTGLKTSSSAAARDEEDLKPFGDFWLLYPKSRDKAATLAAWQAVVASGVDPQKIVSAAVAYAQERKGQDSKFTKYSANWLRDGRYDDLIDLDQPPPAGSNGHQTYRNPTDDSVWDEDLIK